MAIFYCSFPKGLLFFLRPNALRSLMAISEMDGCYFSPWLHKSAGWVGDHFTPCQKWKWVWFQLPAEIPAGHEPLGKYVELFLFEAKTTRIRTRWKLKLNPLPLLARCDLKRLAGRDMHVKCSDFKVDLWLHLSLQVLFIGPYQFGIFFDIDSWLWIVWMTVSHWLSNSLVPW